MNINGVNNGFNYLAADKTVQRAVEQNKFEETINRLTDENKNDKDLKKACMDFEAIFIRMMFKQMRNSIPGSDIIPQSFAKETYEEMYDEKIVDSMIQGKGIGLGQTLYNAMRRQNRSGKYDGGGKGGI